MPNTLLAFILPIALFAPAKAQEPKLEVVVDSDGCHLTAENADVRAILNELLRSSKRSFTIDPRVRATITIELHSLPLETVLAQLCRQSGAVYGRRPDGVYYFIPPPPDEVPRWLCELFPKEEAAEPGLPIGEGNPNGLRGSAAAALHDIFKAIGGTFRLEGNFNGKVTSPTPGAPFQVALNQVLKQIGATCRIEGGVYIIAGKSGPPP